jgi:drug/metabolite transporter (DMT)-like permease
VPPSDNDSDRISRGLIAGAAVLYGSVTVGGKLLYGMGFSLYEISLYPLVLTCAILAPWERSLGRVAVPRGALSLFVVYGLIGALLQLSQFGGIVLGVPVSTVALLLYTEPVWAILLGRVLLLEPVTNRKLFALAATLCGMVVLVQGERVAGVSLLGLACAALGGVFLALWVVWGRKSGLRSGDYLGTTVAWSEASALWLLLLLGALLLTHDGGAWHRLSWDHPWRGWLALGGFTVVAGILPDLLFFRGLRVVTASTAGIILLFEPVSAGLLAVLMFHEPLRLHVVVGGVIILLANFLLPRSV